MKRKEWIEELDINEKVLDEKKQQTDYKIKYITEYVKQWLYVNTNRRELQAINFIDCMSNAGIYSDGDLGTSMEVLSLFVDNARNKPNMVFNLYINDNNRERVEVCKKIALKIMGGQDMSNLRIIYSNMDVNTYLTCYSRFDIELKKFAATILFIDPYDFGTVVIQNIRNFVERYYCEVLFNLFTSDFVRNGIDKRISKCVGNTNIADKDELVQYVFDNIKAGKMKYGFAYQFKTSTNTELYQIIFATPSLKGLDKLKEALWNVFNGKFYHRNHVENDNQISFFTKEDNKQTLIEIHSQNAKQLLMNNFGGREVSYDEIEKFLIEKTMMMTGQFLKYVIKPLIDSGKVIKKGEVRSSNYKGDMYFFQRSKNSENN